MGERLLTAKGKYEPKLEFPNEKGELKPKPSSSKDIS